MWHDRNRFALLAFALVFAFSWAFTACHESAIPGDPKARLSEYVHSSFEVKSVGDKKALAEFLTGDAKTRLEAWSDDQFRDAFIDTKRQFLKLDFREVRPLADDRVNITYEVTYLDQKKSDLRALAPSKEGHDRGGEPLPGGHNAKVTTKKLCELTRVDGKWFINEVRNIKELVEYQDDITISPIH